MEDPQELLNRTVAQLGEHFSSVLILASRSDNDSEGHFTHGLSSGCGDWYSRYGMAVVYVDKADAERRARAIKESE